MPQASKPKNSPIEGLQRAKPVNPPYPEDDPKGAIQLAFEQLKSIFPRETSAASFGERGPIDRFVAPPWVVADTSPFNHIRVNQDWKGGDFRDMDFNRQVMAHELSHVGQNLDLGGIPNRIISAYKGLETPYFERPEEIKANAIMKRVKSRHEDIPLPEEK